MKPLPLRDELLANTYRVVDLLHEGAQTISLRATGVHDQQSYLLKMPAMLPGEPGFDIEQRRVERSARFRFGSPCVQDPVDLFQWKGRAVVVFPFIEGVDLRHLVAQRGIIPEQVAIAMMLQAAGGLQAMHERGVIHRDVKPDNILLETSTGRVFVIDTGLARVIHQPTLSSAHCWSGTPGYLPREQIVGLGAVGPAADLHALGATVYFILTERSAFPGVEAAVSARISPIPDDAWIACAVRQLNPSISTKFEAVIMRLLAPEPKDRFQSASELIATLAALDHAAPRSCGVCGAYQPSSRGAYCVLCGSPMVPLASPETRCLACGGQVAASSPSCPNCHRQFDPKRHRLVVERGPLSGTTLLIPAGSFCVGRDELCAADLYLSRRQMNVQSINGSVALAHAGGPNPTLVNRTPATSPVELRPGTVVHFGASRATYQHT